MPRVFECVISRPIGGEEARPVQTMSAPDPFVAPYFSFMLERTPKGGPGESHIRRKYEYVLTR